MTQDYTDPLFVDGEIEKIACDVVNAFRPQLEIMPSNGRFSQFLRQEGLYLGPYSDTPEDRKGHFKSRAILNDAPSGPKMNMTIDGSESVFVKGMFKHTFNGAAADMNGCSAEYKKNAQSLAEMANDVSKAILAGNMDKALTIVYGKKWENFDPSINAQRHFDRQ